MMSLLIGFSAVVLVVAFSLEGSLSLYMQPHSVILVIGGSLALLFFKTPLRVQRSLWETARGLFRPDIKLEPCLRDLNELSKKKTAAVQSGHPLITYAADLWQQGVEPELFIVLLSQKRHELEGKSRDAVQALKNLAKYPPALGMTGTVMGMITLFSSLDQNKDKIGASLSLAMTATFLGLMLSNFLISPLADRLHVDQIHLAKTNGHFYEILILINRNETSTLVKEELSERFAS